MVKVPLCDQAICVRHVAKQHEGDLRNGLEAAAKTLETIYRHEDAICAVLMVLTEFPGATIAGKKEPDSE